ncbi:acyl-CoA dehydrogenase [Ammoniphilus oxalaticus]|uniref:Acyl-CoA dehydrogenase n=2 Tax=Ammoniphilus oxalaticus TaxID=66863 RepID=A0A419SK86_9BACL|nr:acyl-CoA dehydrogenase [Ammoniphilus oxalaticus]
MINQVKDKEALLLDLIETKLKPKVKAIDTEAFYAIDFLKALGKNGFFSSTHKLDEAYIVDEMSLVEKVAKVCMTTAFCLWCHLAALTFLRNSPRLHIKEKMLPALENGEILGGTGLSNPMKYYAGLEKLLLKAEQSEGGVVLSGTLPAVSNLGSDHWFGVIAETAENKRVMCFVPCSIAGLELKERTDYLGVNGSATYVCSFQDVFIPDEWLITEDADTFSEQIRPVFLLYQIPLGIGVTKAAIADIERVKTKQNSCNQFLHVQATDLKNKLKQAQQRIEDRVIKGERNWKEIVALRLETAYLTLDSVHASMLHNGSSGYLKDSGPSRQLREAYFFANLTPTIKHLEKVLQS